MSPVTRGFISVFASTYLCEKYFFSKINYVNSTYMSSLSDMRLKSILMTINTKLVCFMIRCTENKVHF
jgi:hypothetical protein